MARGRCKPCDQQFSNILKHRREVHTDEIIIRYPGSPQRKLNRDKRGLFRCVRCPYSNINSATFQTHANKCSKPEHQDMLSVSGKGSESTRDSDSGDELEPMDIDGSFSIGESIVSMSIEAEGSNESDEDTHMDIVVSPQLMKRQRSGQDRNLAKAFLLPPEEGSGDNGDGNREDSDGEYIDEEDTDESEGEEKDDHNERIDVSQIPIHSTGSGGDGKGWGYHAKSTVTLPLERKPYRILK
ncbi:hypothetical protein BJ322DRAFT_522484 [Thelephora terrestris]|uniref:Uncharacterized protein n=1 Tax=Thelephora terrestris TaxID=56493 RepID=A0A9P6H1V3_9AGAM|nr:hypothetical protein BJ322DRAFT_522484 [Thelephora terrestris]